VRDGNGSRNDAVASAVDALALRLERWLDGDDSVDGREALHELLAVIADPRLEQFWPRLPQHAVLELFEFHGHDFGRDDGAVAVAFDRIGPFVRGEPDLAEWRAWRVAFGDAPQHVVERFWADAADPDVLINAPARMVIDSFVTQRDARVIEKLRALVSALPTDERYDRLRDIAARAESA
jgi:hypothetical protein